MILSNLPGRIRSAVLDQEQPNTKRATWCFLSLEATSTIICDLILFSVPCVRMPIEAHKHRTSNNGQKNVKAVHLRLDGLGRSFQFGVTLTTVA